MFNYAHSGHMHVLTESCIVQKVPAIGYYDRVVVCLRCLC